MKVKAWVLAHQIISVLIFAAILIILLTIAIANNKASAPSSPTQTNSQGNTVLTVEGEFVCLPHKDTSGPQTLECAFGIKSENTYYAVTDSTSDYSLISKAGTGDRVKVTGTFKERSDSIYQDSGILTITSLEKL